MGAEEVFREVVGACGFANQKRATSGEPKGLGGCLGIGLSGPDHPQVGVHRLVAQAPNPHRSGILLPPARMFPQIGAEGSLGFSTGKQRPVSRILSGQQGFRRILLSSPGWGGGGKAVVVISPHAEFGGNRRDGAQRTENMGLFHGGSFWRFLRALSLWGRAWRCLCESSSEYVRRAAGTSSKISKASPLRR